MEKKNPTTSNPTGVCEKVFNAISPTFRPIRRLNFHRSDPESITVTTNAPPTPTLPSAKGGAKDSTPPVKPEPVRLATEKKPEPVTMPHEKAKATPATANVKVTVDPSPGRANAHDKVMPAPAPPPQSNTVSKPQPSAAPPLPKPQPPPPAAAPERPKTNINEKVGDYISRVRAKMRTGSGVGRAPSS